MSQSLQERFPDLFFDEKTVVEKTPKATPPSIAELMAKILVGYGIQNPGMASDLANAATEFFKGSGS